MRQTIELPVFPVEGGCHCGAVRYALRARPLGVYRCHCKDCQRFSGAAWSMSMIVRRGTLEVTAGETATYAKTADSGRIGQMHACPACGTKLFNAPQSSPDLLVLKPGTLDDSRWAVPIGNIWTRSALPWVAIEPQFPAYPGQPASRDALYAAWNERVAESA
jgi:hypothetical protein